MKNLLRPNDDVPGVAAVAQQGHHRVSLPPITDIRTDPCHDPGDFETGTVGTGRHRVVQPGPHEQVRKVEPHGLDADVHFVGVRVSEGNLSFHEHLGRAVAFDKNGAGLLSRHGRAK